MDDLRDKVASLVAEFTWDVREPDAESIADRILAIPEIREALALFGPDEPNPCSRPGRLEARPRIPPS